MGKQLAKVVEVVMNGLRGLEAEVAMRLTERLIGLGGLALPKSGSVAIDLSWTPYEVTPAELLHLVRSVLEEMDIGEGCDVVLESGRIEVRVRDREAVLEGLRRSGVLRRSEAGEVLHQCPHCGYVTPYEELLREHLKVHYIGV
ncbi:MAG: C2H2-type zinc finger protein [Candidatus Calditenuis sp.]|nr:C2H2-type zinc finger protein [Candidatus Calditenuis sp.]